jgi:hypothetical protein
MKGQIYSASFAFPVSKSSWILDSGATCHVCHDLQLFHS